MSQIAKCPVCGEEPRVDDVDAPHYSYHCCGHAVFADDGTKWNQYAAAMELARAHVTLENAMEPLNSGKLKMGEAMPAIRIAMEDVRACEQRVMEVFK